MDMFRMIRFIKPACYASIRNKAIQTSELTIVKNVQRVNWFAKL